MEDPLLQLAHVSLATALSVLLLVNYSSLLHCLQREASSTAIVRDRICLVSILHSRKRDAIHQPLSEIHTKAI